MVIHQFTGEYRFLSNFYPAEFVWNNIIWFHSEGAYQAAKVLDRDQRLILSKIKSPGEIKRKGKSLVLRPDWDIIKVSIMYDIVKCKFLQNLDLKQQLINTNDLILEEGNTWKDRFWGICPPESGHGENHLGKILIQLRSELKG